MLNVDGFGGQAIKIAKYHAFARTAKAAGLRRGFKLFYKEDRRLMGRARSSRCRRRRTSSCTSSPLSGLGDVLGQQRGADGAAEIAELRELDVGHRLREESPKWRIRLSARM